MSQSYIARTVKFTLGPRQPDPNGDDLHTIFAGGEYVGTYYTSDHVASIDVPPRLQTLVPEDVIRKLIRQRLGHEAIAVFFES